MTKEKVLEIHNLSASYKEKNKKQTVLQDINLTLYEGEIVGLLGESGSGKSTLCRCILQMIQDYKGEIRHYTTLPQMIFQDPYSSLNPKRTIGWILEEPLRMKKITPSDRRRKVYAILSKVGLDVDMYDRYPSELSGGQRQRVCIASALLTECKLIIADEPLSALDVTVQAQMIHLLKDIVKSMGICLFLVTHDEDVAYLICNRIFKLEFCTLVSLKG